MEIIYKHFQSLNSTNDWGKANIRHYSPHVLVLVSADEQTAGRGQYGKKWWSPSKGNLYASFCFYWDANTTPLALTHFLAGIVAETLSNEGVFCTLKWPNDLLVSGKKIAGILCETRPNEPGREIILGIGLNVNIPAEDLKDVGQPATSIFAETGKNMCCQTLLKTLAERFAARLSKLKT